MFFARIRGQRKIKAAFPPTLDGFALILVVNTAQKTQIPGLLNFRGTLPLTLAELALNPVVTAC